MSVAATTRQTKPWRAAVITSGFGLLLASAVFASVAAFWLLNWSYGEETMIGIGANAILITPRLILMAIGSVFGVAATFRVSNVKRGETALVAIVIAAVMCLAIVSWRRFFSERYSDTFYAISVVEVVGAIITGAIGGALGSFAIRLASTMGALRR